MTDLDLCRCNVWMIFLRPNDIRPSFVGQLRRFFLKCRDQGMQDVWLLDVNGCGHGRLLFRRNYQMPIRPSLCAKSFKRSLHSLSFPAWPLFAFTVFVVPHVLHVCCDNEDSWFWNSLYVFDILSNWIRFRSSFSLRSLPHVVLGL